MQDNNDVRSKLKYNAEKQGLDRKLESTDKKNPDTSNLVSISTFNKKIEKIEN